MFFYTTVLIACNTLTAGSEPAAPATESNAAGYSWGDAGSSDDGSTEADTDTESDSDTGTDGGSDTDTGTDSDTAADTEEVEPVMIDAYIVLFPAAEWEASLSTAGSPVVYMYETANATTGDWAGYGETTSDASGTSDVGVVIDEETFTPGDTLVVGAMWSDGYSNRYFADSGNTVRSTTDDWDNDGDEEMAVIIIYSDNTFAVLEIDSTGTTTTANAAEGQAYYVDSSGGAEVYVHTPANTTGDYDL